LVSRVDFLGTGLPPFPFSFFPFFLFYGGFAEKCGGCSFSFYTPPYFNPGLSLYLYIISFLFFVAQTHHLDVVFSPPVAPPAPKSLKS